MKISIFTPTYKESSKYLLEAYESLKEQTFEEWQWVILINNGGYVPKEVMEDNRVKVIDCPENENSSNIGFLKNYCAKNCDGEILVELDADDMLTENALAEIYSEFLDPNIVFVYSNSAEFYDGSWKARVYSEYWGWRKRHIDYKGHILVEMLAWQPGPQMMRRVEWAPNHVRCWRASSYWKIGGHDVTLKSGDDHDLCCRTFIEYGQYKMKLIDKCLYLYRLHEKNECIVNNNDVQAQVAVNYNKYSRLLAIKWAEDNNLLKLDLGGRFNKWNGFKSVDLIDGDLCFDLNGIWNLEDNSVGVINATDIFEHLHDSINTMNEAFRVLAPGGFLFINVPSTDGRGAFQDPTHVSFWNENSIAYYTNKDLAKFIKPKYTGRFQNARTITYFPNKYCEEKNISYVQADLIALKGWYAERPVGEVLI